MSSSGNTSSVFVLDGGFSGQLSRHVGASPDGDPLWCSKFLQTNPDAVIKTHLDYIRAGSDIVETNTYQASVGGFVEHLGVTPEEGYALIIRAVELAKHARDTYIAECKAANQPVRTVLIAGSIGPYGAYLHDGSEYDGSYADKVGADTMREWHTPRIKALIEAGVDLLAIETLPCSKEAEVIVNMLKDYPHIKAWLSFSCKDEHSLANGEDFKTVATKCWDMNPEQLVAVGVNCCPPSIVSKLFKGINDGRQSLITFITYPNSGEKYKVKEGWVGKDKCEPLTKFVDEWLDIGVKYIGSCCRTCDADISQIKEQVQNWLKAKNNI